MDNLKMDNLNEYEKHLIVQIQKAAIKYYHVEGLDVEVLVNISYIVSTEINSAYVGWSVNTYVPIHGFKGYDKDLYSSSHSSREKALEGCLALLKNKLK